MKIRWGFVVAGLLAFNLSILLSFGQRDGRRNRFEQFDQNGDGKVTPDEFRFDRLFRRLDRNRDGAITPDELPAQFRDSSPTQTKMKVPPEPKHSKFLDIQYQSIEGVAPKLLSLDIYTPVSSGSEASRGQGKSVAGAGAKDSSLGEKHSVQKRPVLIMIHGGAWRMGDKQNQQVVRNKMRYFVGRGYVFVSINYRLSSRGKTKTVKFPAHAEDCAAATAWVHNHISKYGGDPDQLHLMGHSAGAHLAGLLGTHEKLLKQHGKPLSILKSNVLLDTAAIDIPGYLETANSRAKALYTGVFGETDEDLKAASPMTYVQSGKNMPPTLLFYGGKRMRLDYFADRFAKAMTSAGAPSRAIDTVDLTHREINEQIGMLGEPMTQLVVRLHNGEDVTKFPSVLPGKSKAPKAK